MKREFLRRLKYAFDSVGIEIPYPHLALYVGDAAGRAPFAVELSGASRR